MVRFFWSSPLFGRNMLGKSRSAKGPAQCKSVQGNNMTDEIIELKLTWPGPPGRTCTAINGCFYDKTKISKKNFQGFAISG